MHDLVATEFIENDEEHSHHNDDTEDDESVSDRLQRQRPRVVRLRRERRVQSAIMIRVDRCRLRSIQQNG